MPYLLYCEAKEDTPQYYSQKEQKLINTLRRKVNRLFKTTVRVIAFIAFVLTICMLCSEVFLDKLKSEDLKPLANEVEY